MLHDRTRNRCMVCNHVANVYQFVGSARVVLCTRCNTRLNNDMKQYVGAERAETLEKKRLEYIRTHG